MNQKNNNNSESNPAKSRKIEKKEAIIQGSPLLESQNSALIKILNKINSKKLKWRFIKIDKCSIKIKQLKKNIFKNNWRRGETGLFIFRNWPGNTTCQSSNWLGDNWYSFYWWKCRLDYWSPMLRFPWTFCDAYARYRSRLKNRGSMTLVRISTSITWYLNQDSTS